MIQIWNIPLESRAAHRNRRGGWPLTANGNPTRTAIIRYDGFDGRHIDGRYPSTPSKKQPLAGVTGSVQTVVNWNIFIYLLYNYRSYRLSVVIDNLL